MAFFYVHIKWEMQKAQRENQIYRTFGTADECFSPLQNNIDINKETLSIVYYPMANPVCVGGKIDFISFESFYNVARTLQEAKPGII